MCNLLDNFVCDPMRVTVSEKGLSVTESPFFVSTDFPLHTLKSSIRHWRIQIRHWQIAIRQWRTHIRQCRIEPLSTRRLIDIYQLDKSAFASIFLSTLSGSLEKKS